MGRVGRWGGGEVGRLNVEVIYRIIGLCCMKVSIEHPFRFSVVPDMKGEPSGSYITLFL